jgi:hypothetical protein
VFLWTPALSPAGERIPHGFIFAIFMTASMVGTALAGRAVRTIPLELLMQVGWQGGGNIGVCAFGSWEAAGCCVVNRQNRRALSQRCVELSVVGLRLDDKGDRWVCMPSSPAPSVTCKRCICTQGSRNSSTHGVPHYQPGLLFSGCV